MSAEIFNLRRVRKAKVRTDKAEKAAENRARFGRSKAQREKEALEQARARQELDGAWRTNDDRGSDGGT